MTDGDRGDRGGEERQMTWQLPYSTPNHCMSMEAVYDRGSRCTRWEKTEMRCLCCAFGWNAERSFKFLKICTSSVFDTLSLHSFCINFLSLSQNMNRFTLKVLLLSTLCKRQNIWQVFLSRKHYVVWNIYSVMVSAQMRFSKAGLQSVFGDAHGLMFTRRGLFLSWCVPASKLNFTELNLDFIAEHWNLKTNACWLRDSVEQVTFQVCGFS